MAKGKGTHKLIDSIVSAILVLCWSAFTMYFFLLVSSDDLPASARDHVNMIVGGMIMLLGVFTKIMQEQFAKKG